MKTGFHLPHNAILPEEVKFILSLLDENEDYYLYDALKAKMFEEEIRQEVFEKFHRGMYKNFMENERLKFYYDKVLSGEMSYDDIKRIPYSPKKTLNGCWNEQSRDYFEFIAFTGLLPSYYKGRAVENEKRYYVGDTLKKYKSGILSYQDILFKMKFRNASKNYENIEQYNVRNRPFVVAIKVLNILKNKGYTEIDGDSLSFIIRNIKNEDDLETEELISKIEPIDFSSWTKSAKKEIGRGTTFLKRHLNEELKIDLISEKPIVFGLESFNISNYKFKDKAVYIGDIYNDLEVTPLFIKYLSNPSLIEDKYIKEEMQELGLINQDESLFDFNIDTDLMDRNLVMQVNLPITPAAIYSNRIETTDLFREGKEISESGQGTAYEEFLYSFMNNKFGKDEKNKDRVKYLGANTVGQRLSDIICDLEVQDNGIKNKIRLIVEAKSGGAIHQFDERKEIDNIMNTLTDNRFHKDYDGIWYIVVDSNRMPSDNGHGGFRNNNNQLSFYQKLLKIQSTIMPATTKLTMVTAFSYTEFMKFMDNIDYNKNMNYITKIQAPDFWTWSNRFIETSYVTVRA